MNDGDDFAWRPDERLVRNSHLQRFMDRHGLASFDALLDKSARDVSWFWGTMLHELGVVFDKRYTRVVDESGGPQRPRWCVGGEMNVTASLLDRWRDTPTDAKPAIKWEGEEGQNGSISYRDLRHRVGRAAGGLRALGVGRGEVVGVFMPMTPQCVVAMLAVIRVGGIFLPLFSGYGPAALATRLNDAGAAAVFCADGFLRRGRLVPMKPTLDAALEQCPSVRRVIVHQRVGNDVEMRSGRDVWWRDAIDNQPDHAGYEVCGADEPCMLIYTSGTTGRPKGAVHAHCGFPVKAAQDVLHCMDLHADETLFWVTDMGWMMGPWEVFGTLMTGATMLLYDGALDHPDAGRLWQLCEAHHVTTLGVSPTLIRALMQHGDGPVRQRDLSKLRKFASTGEPWNPGPWRWLFESVGGGRLPILNYSGGTEISGGILGGNVLTPMRPCAFSGPIPGMAVDLLNDRGRSVKDRPGEVGELVLTRPWIGMARGFWNDEQRYLDTYWGRHENVWVHGDWASVDADGLWYIHGRSDDTIKVAGKRLGPAEVESLLVGHPAVKEAAAVGVPDELKGEALVCFCVLTGNTPPSAALEAELSGLIAAQLGRPLTPKAVAFVADLPRTRNGKIMRRVARSAYLGEDAGDLSALENPIAVEALRAAGVGFADSQGATP